MRWGMIKVSENMCPDTIVAGARAPRAKVKAQSMVYVMYKSYMAIWWTAPSHHSEEVCVGLLQQFKNIRLSWLEALNCS